MGYFDFLDQSGKRKSPAQQSFTQEETEAWLKKQFRLTDEEWHSRHEAIDTIDEEAV